MFLAIWNGKCAKLKQKQKKNGERNESFRFFVFTIQCVCVYDVCYVCVYVFTLSVWYAEFEMKMCVSLCSHRWFFCRNAKATVNKLHTQINGKFLSESK